MWLVKLETEESFCLSHTLCPIHDHVPLIYLLVVSETHPCCHVGLDSCSRLGFLCLSPLWHLESHGDGEAGTSLGLTSEGL